MLNARIVDVGAGGLWKHKMYNNEFPLPVCKATPAAAHCSDHDPSVSGIRSFAVPPPPPPPKPNSFRHSVCATGGDPEISARRYTTWHIYARPYITRHAHKMYSNRMILVRIARPSPSPAPPAIHAPPRAPPSDPPFSHRGANNIRRRTHFWTRQNFKNLRTDDYTDELLPLSDINVIFIAAAADVRVLLIIVSSASIVAKTMRSSYPVYFVRRDIHCKTSWTRDGRFGNKTAYANVCRRVLSRPDTRICSTTILPCIWHWARVPSDPFRATVFITALRSPPAINRRYRVTCLRPNEAGATVSDGSRLQHNTRHTLQSRLLP